MQVYANTFKVEGEGAYRAVLGAIHGWIVQLTGRQFSLSDLTRDDEFSSGNETFRWWLKSYVSANGNPELYAWRLKHVDPDVPGRQWIVELGLKVDGEGLEFSCSLLTEEQSTLVRTPIDATRPRVVGYVLGNVTKAIDAHISADVPGLEIQQIGLHVESYDILRSEIERRERDFPLVLVSPMPDGTYLINRQHLQNALFGLAQVVEIDPGFDSYEMEERLGRVWSAWGGAINILQTPRANGFVHGSLMRAQDIEDLGETQSERVSHILARVKKWLRLSE